MNGIEKLIPPHANAEVHKRVMAALAVATPAEHREVLIEAGIMTKSGKLAAHYRPSVRRKKSAKRRSRRAPARAKSR